MRRFKAAFLCAIGAALGLATPVFAQSWQCRAPDNLARPHLEIPKKGQIRRTPIDGYVLALSWSREYCKSRGAKARGKIQCNGQIGDFGFILHGLWPEAKGPDYPQYCRKAALLSRDVIKRNICMTPDVQLLQHEWTKHGSCMARKPQIYFKAARLMFHAIDLPDMDRISRKGQKGAKQGKPLTVGAFTQIISDMNAGLPAHAIRLKTNKRGWLQEMRICLAKNFRPRRCPSHMRGARGSQNLKIWRGS